MKRGRRRHDGLDTLLPGKQFVREQIRELGKIARREHPGRPATISDRDIDFIARYCAGATLREIGESYGISRERVRQRLAKMGLTSQTGGRAVRSLLSASARLAKSKTQQERQAARTQRIWGIPVAQQKAIRAAHGYEPFHAFTMQRKQSRARGIAWAMTFAEWWGLWQESGKWLKRGRGRNNYCMARWADDGPYDIKNAHICTCKQNGQEYQEMRNLRGRPKAVHTGIYLLYPGMKNAHVAKIGRRYVGAFATVEEAIAARERALAEAA